MLFTLPKGTIVKIKGIPLELTRHTRVETAPENYKLFFNQDEQSSENPTQADSVEPS